MMKDTERLKKIINTHLRSHEEALLSHIKEIFPCVKDKKENVSLLIEEGLQILDVPWFLISKETRVEPVNVLTTREVYKFWRNEAGTDYHFYEEYLTPIKFTDSEVNRILEMLKDTHAGTISKYIIIETTDLYKLKEKEVESIKKFIKWLKESYYKNDHFLNEGSEVHSQSKIFITTRKIKFFNLF